MSHFKKFASRIWRDESGATAIEYGLLAALIAVVIIGAVSQLGGELTETFTAVDTELDTANEAPPPAAD